MMAFDGQAEIGQVASLATEFEVCETLPQVDPEFLEQLKQGDAIAFDVLITRYSTDVYRLLVRLTEDLEEARDLTQETFLRAFQFVKNFRGDADLKTWLYRIAINQARNRWRWWNLRKREATVSLDAETGSGANSWHEILPDRKGRTPEFETLQNERERVLRKALLQLPEQFREAVILRDIEGLSYEEIAQTLETGIGTIKSRIARGRLELKRKLQSSL
jgi:RNA polymerase sigma-70 factor (ECF subfamily)